MTEMVPPVIFRKVRRVPFLACEAVQAIHQIQNPVATEPGTEVNREKFPGKDHVADGVVRYIAVLKILLHGCFRQIGEFFLIPCAKIRASRMQDLSAFRLNRCGFPVGDIHFGYKEEHWNLIAGQKFPQGLGMGLNTVDTADDQNGIVQNREDPFRFCRKVYVSRCVQQDKFRFTVGEGSGVGKDGNPALAFHLIRIHVRAAVVHPSAGTDRSCSIKHLF